MGGGVREGSWMYEVGKTEKNPIGLAHIVNKNFTEYAHKFDKHSGRIISCKYRLKGKTSLQIIQIYAPTSEHDDETVENIFKELEKTVDKNPADITF